MSRERFCKRCGAKIDSISNKCSSCGKQYFKFRATHLVIILLSMITVLSVCVTVFLTNQIIYIKKLYQDSCYNYDYAFDQWKSAEKRANEAEKNVAELERDAMLNISNVKNSTWNDIKEIYGTSDVMESSFVSDQKDPGGYYHLSSCKHAREIPVVYRIYFPTAYIAEANGHHKCPDCKPR